MNKVLAKTVVEMIGAGYTHKIVREAVRRIIIDHQYFPFKNLEDLESIVYHTCQEKNWNLEDALVIHSNQEQQGWFAAIIIPNITLEKFVEVMKRFIKLRAFL